MTEKTIEAMIFKILNLGGKGGWVKLIYLAYIYFNVPPVLCFFFEKIFLNIMKFCQYK